MQTISFCNSFKRSIHKQDSYINNKDIITIMCIGESTTEKGYPIFLKEYLDKYKTNIKFNIVDTGYSAIRLDELYYKTKKNIEIYKPDIIVGMIGINDMIDYTFQSYSKIKTIYLFQLIVNHYKLIKYSIHSDTINDNYCITDEEIDEAENIIFKLSNLICTNNNSTFLDEIINKKQERQLLYGCTMKNEFLRIFIEKYCGQQKSKLKVKDIISNILLDNTIKKEFRYGIYGICNMFNNKYETGNKYIDMSNQERLNYDYTEISKKYEKILDLIIPKNIKYIAMQYPVRDISSLKKIIQNTRYKNDVIFVDNKNSFIEALKGPEKYNIFEDLFAWDFGHCKKYGNRLIAENLAKEIITTFKFKNIGEK